jgi:two-component system LytT family sensor kinase
MTVESARTVRDRLRADFTIRELRILGGAIVAISLFLTLSSLSLHARFAWTTAGYAFYVNTVFSAAIALSCYTLVNLSGVFSLALSWRRLFCLIGVLLLGGILGTVIARSIVRLTLGAGAGDMTWSRLLIFDAVAALFFGIAIDAYYMLRMRSERLARALCAHEIQTQQLAQAKTRAELAALRARINPHFLFNTLNSIAELVRTDAAGAEDMIQKLAHVFRYVLDAGNRESVTLGEEIETVERYLAIEQVRLGGRLQSHFEVEEKARAVRLPALLLQPLVENAIKHGIAPQAGGGQVAVDCRIENERCVITVRDTGPGFSEEAGAGFGLRSVRERLDLSYGDDYRFEIQDGDGACVRISLPTAAPEPRTT